MPFASRNVAFTSIGNIPDTVFDSIVIEALFVVNERVSPVLLSISVISAKFGLKSVTVKVVISESEILLP